MDDHQPRAPYGRRRRDREMQSRPDSPRSSRQYRGESYYGRPAIRPSHWGWMIAGYYFVGGLSGGAQVIVTVADLVDPIGNRAIVRAGRYLSLAGLLASTPLLIADLHTPKRFANMLRIVRPTSPMSMGTWTLSIFSLAAGLTAFAQLLDDTTDTPAATTIARICSIPAALSGLMMASYTGALTATTSVPLWASLSHILPTLFGLASSASAIAAITLVIEAGDEPEAAAKLEPLALLIGAAEVVTHAMIIKTWQQKGVTGAITTTHLNPAHKVGMVGLGALLPTAIHLLHNLSGRRSRETAISAAVATLVGIFIERVVIIFGGNESARRPTDYLQFTQPEAAKGSQE